MLEFPIHLHYTHRVIFTDAVFHPENEKLSEVLAMAREHRRQRTRVLVYLDAGLAEGCPAMLGQIASWFAFRSAHYDLRMPPILLSGGEACKNNFARVEQIWAQINEAALDRHSYVLVVGGGALLDLVGLASATAHRGIRLIRLPSTTLSQADGGVGVKNGINFFGKKNWVGTFAVPFAIVNDLKLLDSLGDEERRGGYIEAIKVALIRDESFFEYMESNVEEMKRFDPKVLRRVIERSAELHVRHIATGGDPFELGSARPLDFGHWVAHKLEQITQFTVSHGEAVAMGIAVDLVYAHLAGMLEERVCVRALKLIDDLGFRLWHDALLLPATDDSSQLAVVRGLEEFREHLGGDLCITLVIDVGSAVEVREMDESRVRQAIEKLHALSLVS